MSIYVSIYLAIYLPLSVSVYIYTHIYGSFPIGLIFNCAQFELHSFLMICRIGNDKRQHNTRMTTLAPNQKRAVCI